MISKFRLAEPGPRTGGNCLILGIIIIGNQHERHPREVVTSESGPDYVHAVATIHVELAIDEHQIAGLVADLL